MSDRNDSRISLSSDLQALKDRLQAEGLLTHPVSLCFGVNDDTTLFRFLSARKFIIPDAIAQYRSAQRIREINHVEEFCQGMDLQSMEETRNIYPKWSGRLCKKGQPIFTFDSSRLDSLTMATYRSSSATLSSRPPDGISIEALRSFLVFDELTGFIMPLCSMLAEKQISKMVLLVDISSLGMSQVWNLRGYLQDFSKTLSTSFPEILDKVFIMGASGAFPTIWNLVKRWTDPETASKFVVLSSTEVLPTLRDRIDIENIPGKYGGRFKEEENQRPLPDGSVEQALEWMPGHGKTFPRGLLRWQLSPTEDMMKAVAATGDGGQLSVAHFANLCAGQNCQL